ncbi:MAG: hypothetical protein HYU64_20705 [Armatimonadetes bacterium]|nr:hypothetical protein [Armatimonadota bacterium]
MTNASEVTKGWNSGSWNPGGSTPWNPNGSNPGGSTPWNPNGSNPGGSTPWNPNGSNPGGTSPWNPGGSNPGGWNPGGGSGGWNPGGCDTYSVQRIAQDALQQITYSYSDYENLRVVRQALDRISDCSNEAGKLGEEVTREVCSDKERIALGKEALRAVANGYDKSPQDLAHLGMEMLESLGYYDAHCQSVVALDALEHVRNMAWRNRIAEFTPLAVREVDQKANNDLAEAKIARIGLQHICSQEPDNNQALASVALEMMNYSGADAHVGSHVGATALQYISRNAETQEQKYIADKGLRQIQSCFSDWEVSKIARNTLEYLK